MLRGAACQGCALHLNIRRGSFENVRVLTAAIERFTREWNAGGTPFTWVKTADEILAKAVRKTQADSGAGHQCAVGRQPNSRAADSLTMDHRDHVRLLREGVRGGGKTWADLGSGEGAFTLALADLLGPTGSIHTVDRDGRALQVQVRALRGAFPSVSVTPLVADFTMPVALPPLDGIVLANSLHFERDKLAVLRLVGGYLRTAGRLVLVEYDTDHGNAWVPYPLSFHSWTTVAAEAGFRETQLLASIPSRFLGSIYSALSFR